MGDETNRLDLQLRAEFGDIDIYVFDQLLRGHITRHHRVLDAGCGGGRNLVFLLKQGVRVHAVDADAGAVASVRGLAASLGADGWCDRVRHEAIDRMSWTDGAFDVVLCSAVLHFARDPAHFAAMVGELWRVLAPEGLLFARLASTIGLDPATLQPAGADTRRFTLPDGSERFLVDEPLLSTYEHALGGCRVDPLKTTVVHGQRAMTTWVVRKSGPPALRA
jgi:SAM-dependent methyltransferase